MSKILYPVGTKVVLSEYAKRDHENLTPLYVVEYRKGKKFPYGLSSNKYGSPETLNGHKWRSVKGLKRYNPTQAKATQTCSDVASPKQIPTQEYYTREEVDGLIKHTIEYVLGQVNSIAFDLRNAILIGAETTDHNFGTVVKKFKTLNHDDD